jgi:hypothetical protein
MNMSTNHGRHRIRPAFIWLAETGLFRGFQYLTVPLTACPELLALAAGRLEAGNEEHQR